MASFTLDKLFRIRGVASNNSGFRARRNGIGIFSVLPSLQKKSTAVKGAVGRSDSLSYIMRHLGKIKGIGIFFFDNLQYPF